MSSVIPPTPPTARSYLAQQLTRLRLAAKELITELDQISKRVQEVRADAVLVLAALDQIEEDESRKESSLTCEKCGRSMVRDKMLAGPHCANPECSRRDAVILPPLDLSVRVPKDTAA